MSKIHRITKVIKPTDIINSILKEHDLAIKSRLEEQKERSQELKGKTWQEKQLKYNIIETCWFTSQAVCFLGVLLYDNPYLKVLELGSGGSTLWLSKRVKHLISVEHNKKWMNKIKNELKKRKLNATMFYYPEPYHEQINNFSKEKYDLIIVDGYSDRTLPAITAKKLVKKGGYILVDDTEQEFGKEIEKEFLDWQMVKTREKRWFNDLYKETTIWRKPNV